MWFQYINLVYNVLYSAGMGTFYGARACSQSAYLDSQPQNKVTYTSCRTDSWKTSLDCSVSIECCSAWFKAFRSLTCIAMSHCLKFFIIKSFYHFFIILVANNVGNNELTFFYVAIHRAGWLRLSFNSYIRDSDHNALIEHSANSIKTVRCVMNNK